MYIQADYICSVPPRLVIKSSFLLEGGVSLRFCPIFWCGFARIFILSCSIVILHQADCSMLSIILSLVHPYKIQSLPAVRRNVRHADKIIAFVASVSVRFRSRGTRVISHAIKTENPFPRSFFAPKPNGNACYAG